jgi:hypothetical protein
LYRCSTVVGRVFIFAAFCAMVGLYKLNPFDPPTA